MIDRGLRPSAVTAVTAAVIAVVIACLAATGCGRQEPAPSTPIQLVTGPSALTSGAAVVTAALASAPDGASVISFPPRNEPFAFRQELELKYDAGHVQQRDLSVHDGPQALSHPAGTLPPLGLPPDRRGR